MPVSRLSKMQICPVLTLSGPVRRTKKATGKRVTHCSYADCSQTPCKHDSPRLGFIMQSQDKLSYLGKASQSSSNKKPIRLEGLFFIEVAYFVPEIHCTQSLLYLQGTTFYRYRWLLVLQINKQRPKVPADAIQDLILLHEKFLQFDWLRAVSGISA